MHLLGVTEVVASAGHHLLMTGPPGAGKTMQAREWDLQTRREGGTPRMGADGRTDRQAPWTF